MAARKETIFVLSHQLSQKRNLSKESKDKAKKGMKLFKQGISELLILNGKYNQDQLSHRISIIYLVPISCAVFVFFMFSKYDFFSDNYNARYMLSALAQSEAAVIAIFVTITIVGIQLGATYSPRVARIFSRSSEFKVLVFSYVLTILYSLWVLGTLETNYEIHIRISYSLGVFCFMFLLIYSVDLFNTIEPSGSIGKLTKKINKTNMLKGEEVFLPIIDIVKGSMTKHDERTVKRGLKMIGDKIIRMLEEEEFDQKEEKQISNILYWNLRKLGRFAIDKKDEDSFWIITENIERIGIKAIEKKLENFAIKAANSLSYLGNKAIEKKFINFAEQSALCLFELGETAIENEIQNVVLIIRFLNVLRKNAIRHELGELFAEMWLEQLRELAVRNENKNLVSYLNRVLPNNFQSDIE
jgi:hypothetical protein